MTDQPQQQTWLSAITVAAKRQRIELPPFDQYGMGALRSVTVHGRFVTLKRLRGPDGVEWALWDHEDGIPVVTFRDPLEPDEESVALTFPLLKGWLLDEWTPDEAREYGLTSCPSKHTIRSWPVRGISGESRSQ